MTRRRQTIATRLSRNAAHGGHADDIQRDRHERGHGNPGQAQGQLQGEERHWTGLHVVLHQSLYWRAESLPLLNAEIQGLEIVKKGYYDIGIAVGTNEGLVVPVVRDADQKTFAGIEKSIADLAKRARENTLTLPELQGGTFTITNGGIFGSMMSTPILNGPQVGILGLHAIDAASGCRRTARSSSAL